MGTNPKLRLWEQNSILNFIEVKLENLKKHTLTHTHTDTHKHQRAWVFSILQLREMELIKICIALLTEKNLRQKELIKTFCDCKRGS